MRKERANSLMALLIAVGIGNAVVMAHEGPDPVVHWIFDQKHIQGKVLHARLGPDGTMNGRIQVIRDTFGETVLFGGPNSGCTVAEGSRRLGAFVPEKEFTVSAWFSVDVSQRWGGIVGVFQDNGDAESGWVLGYNHDTFTFGLASQGANDGNGEMTYLSAKTRYQKGRLYHVVGVYDGTKMQLYVNGKLEGLSREQSGSVLYPSNAPWTIAAYHDDNEYYPHQGRLRDIRIYHLAAKQAWVEQAFAHHRELAELPAEVALAPFDFTVKPYLQYVTKNGITVMWETSRLATSKLWLGDSREHLSGKAISGEHQIHEVRIDRLDSDTQYFYQVESTDAGGKQIRSEISTFQTAVEDETPFAFAVISDTQGNPSVAGKLAKLSWSHRPHFLVHPGDLVSTGTNRQHWVQQFFPSMQPLISRVAFFPVLGNHEQNADAYYHYMSLPDPEYYYSFRYGNADFFMIDTNQKVGPGSEQFQWLEQSLRQSTSRWRFVCHHHPPFSSDENDYGDLWKTRQSTRGDLRARQLVPLYERYEVDVVWNGHIHSYERTWPVRDGRAVETGAPLYMITGGGGGSLETPGPFRPFFQNNVRRGHHAVMVYVNGGTLELKAFSLEGQLFDSLKLIKK